MQWKDVTDEAAGSLRVAFAADAQQGRLLRAQVTLGNAGVVTAIDLPDWVRGFRLRPAANDVYYAVGEDPAGLTGLSGAAIDAGASFGIGGLAKADESDARSILPGEGRDLRLQSGTGATVVEVELFTVGAPEAEE